MSTRLLLTSPPVNGYARVPFASLKGMRVTSPLSPLVFMRFMRTFVEIYRLTRPLSSSKHTKQWTGKNCVVCEGCLEAMLQSARSRDLRILNKYFLSKLPPQAAPRRLLLHLHLTLHQFQRASLRMFPPRLLPPQLRLYLPGRRPLSAVPLTPNQPLRSLLMALRSPLPRMTS